MNEVMFKNLLLAVAAIFSVFFIVYILPAFFADPDLTGAFAAGFVNPFSTGYSTDVIFCWVALAIWVFYENQTYSVKHGWICLILGVIPGVAVGFALYLVLRHRQIVQSKKTT